MCVYEMEKEDIKNWKTISLLPISLMIILNTIFFMYASMLVMKEF